MANSLSSNSAAFGDRYRLGRELGRGGMATVYLADDLRHGRQVAFKALQPAFAAAIGGDRFLREIETTARLQHPHVLPLFDSGEIEGRLFYVMPFVEGGTLRDRLDRDGRLPLPDAIRIAREVAGALDYAHGRGVLHRDVKPENILLSDGHALVADFGIARAGDGAASRLTEAGMAIGTPAYMSPEQALGDEVAGAADQYSLACVVFEMLSGTPPFAAPTAQALLARRLTEEPPSLASVGARDAPGLDAVLARGLARDAGDRFASLGEFAAAFAAAGPAAADIAARPALARTVVVLEFVNLSKSESHDWLATGIAETVGVDLQRVAGIQVLPWETGRRADPPPSAQGVADIGRSLGARWVVTGSFQVQGGRIRITPRFHDTLTGTTIGATKLDGALDDVFALQDLIVDELLRAVDIDPTAAEAEVIARPETAALEAYRCYAAGRQCFNRFGVAAFDEAAGHFRRAIELDSGYALAHAGLGSIAVFRFIATTDPRDLEVGIAQLGRAIELDPGRAEPHQWLTYGYLRAGRLDAAEAAGIRATTLDPRSAMAHYFLAATRCVMGDERHDWQRFVQAADGFQRSIASEPAYLQSYGLLASLYLMGGRHTDAHLVLALGTRLEWSGSTRGPAFPGTASYLACLLAMREGRMTDAERGVQALLVRLDGVHHMYVPAFRAMALLTRAGLAGHCREWDRAVADCLEAKDLVERHRSHLGMGHLLVRARLELGRAFLGLGDRGEAQRHHRAALEVIHDPADWDFRWGVEMNGATQHRDLAGFHAAAGDVAAAVAALGEAVDRGWGDFAALRHDDAFSAVLDEPALRPLLARVRHRSPLPAFGAGGGAVVEVSD